MKTTLWVSVAIMMASAPAFAAVNSCERVKAEIQQKIMNNGVAETAFTLSIVPNDQADQPDAQVVGHCANDTQKILYVRTSSGNSPATSPTPQDDTRGEPQ